MPPSVPYRFASLEYFGAHACYVRPAAQPEPSNAATFWLCHPSHALRQKPHRGFPPIPASTVVLLPCNRALASSVDTQRGSGGKGGSTAAGLLVPACGAASLKRFYIALALY